jgi:hypothetical protein
VQSHGPPLLYAGSALCPLLSALSVEATAISPPRPRAIAADRAAAIPWYIYCALVASTSIIVGVIWDISWHRSIGRDTFWTPAHLAIYLGGLLGGGVAGVRILRATFAAGAAERAASVGVLGFRGPLGAWVSAWGAGAMLLSAPFDDWWHNAYGLDVKILSPPHTVLAFGIYAIGVGAMLTVLAEQNRATSDDARRRFGAMYAYLAGILVTMAAVFVTEYVYRTLLHSSIAYRVSALVFPIFLVAVTRASTLRWPATAVAGFYMLITAAMVWVLPLFPAEPKLAPIHQHITRMVPPDFPLLLVVPAAAMDLTLRWWRGRFSGGRADWGLAALLGAVFVAVFFAVQWPMAELLMSPHGRNWFFAGDNVGYSVPSTASAARNEFFPWDARHGTTLRGGLLQAVVISAVSARLGLWWGGWMRRVRR